MKYHFSPLCNGIQCRIIKNWLPNRTVKNYELLNLCRIKVFCDYIVLLTHKFTIIYTRWLISVWKLDINIRNYKKNI